MLLCLNYPVPYQFPVVPPPQGPAPQYLLQAPAPEPSRLPTSRALASPSSSAPVATTTSCRPTAASSRAVLALASSRPSSPATCSPSSLAPWLVQGPPLSHRWHQAPTLARSLGSNSSSKLNNNNNNSNSNITPTTQQCLLRETSRRLHILPTAATNIVCCQVLASCLPRTTCTQGHRVTLHRRSSRWPPPRPHRT